MARMTTIKALERLLHDEDYLALFLKAGFKREDRHTFRHRLDNGQLSTERMEAILNRCGAVVVQEKAWKLPPS